MRIAFMAFPRRASPGSSLRQIGFMEERILQIARHHRADQNSGDIRYAADTLRHLPLGSSWREQAETAWWQGLTEAGWSVEEVGDFMRKVTKSLGEYKRRR